MKPVRLEFWSDYLCPWCHLADHRLKILRREFTTIELEFRAYLLRPKPEVRDREKFLRYTQHWLRPAAEPDAPRFQVWESAASPPSHSVPAHIAARAAARLGPEAFETLHARLFAAYFEQSRDISDDDTLRALWRESALPAAAFEQNDEAALLGEVLAQHNEALELGISGVPALRVVGSEAFVLGAQPLATYRRWLERLASHPIA